MEGDTIFKSKTTTHLLKSFLMLVLTLSFFQRFNIVFYGYGITLGFQHAPFILAASRPLVREPVVGLC